MKELIKPEELFKLIMMNSNQIGKIIDVLNSINRQLDDQIEINKQIMRILQ